MRYEGDIYRPPSEAFSLLVQVTVGCAHNDCTFCSMFKAKRFHVRELAEVLEDLRDAKQMYGAVRRIFLCDGDALCLATEKLLKILEEIRLLFPTCERVGIYACAQDILRKTPEELQLLRDAGLKIAYIGAESGSDEILKRIKKGVCAREIIEAVNKVEDAGIAASVTFISGLGGRERMEEHAIRTGEMISAMRASYVGLLTLMVEPDAPLYSDIQNGRFTVLSAEEAARETAILLRHANPQTPCVFRSNHASNYVSLRGDLPKDRDKMLQKLETALAHTELLKDERLRML